jgi:hypothetical protein
MLTGLPAEKQRLIDADCYYKFTDMLEEAFRAGWKIIPGTIKQFKFDDPQGNSQTCYLAVIER